MNYCEDVSLDAISEATGYNKKYLSTSFKRDFSISINDYLMLLRIQKAAELLLFSEANVTSLYKEVGFNNNNNFNRVFKKIVGVPPSQYRKSYPDGVKSPSRATPHSRFGSTGELPIRR